MQLFIFKWPRESYNAGLAVVAAASWEEAEKLLLSSGPQSEDRWQREEALPIESLVAQDEPKLIARLTYARYLPHKP